MSYMIAISRTTKLKAKDYGIVSTEDNSDDMVRRLKLNFNNGFSLSVISGYGSYGGEDGLFEVALFNKMGEFCGQDELPDLFEYDDVVGHLDFTEVKQIMKRVSEI